MKRIISSKQFSSSQLLYQIIILVACVMSFEEIISAIQEKPEIWLSSHTLYKNRVVKAKAWRELAVKLIIEEDTLKKRWKYLKDQYRRELKKQPVLRSGTESDDWESTWQYFNVMSFVKDDIMPAPSTGNLNVNETSNSEETENDIYDLDTEIIGSVTSPLSRHSLASSSASQLSSTSRKRTNIRDDMLEIERKKLTLMEKRLTESQNADEINKDEDYLFLKSILPSMKKLTLLQKLQFRGKINDWLIETLTQNELDFHS